MREVLKLKMTSLDLRSNALCTIHMQNFINLMNFWRGENILTFLNPLSREREKSLPKMRDMTTRMHNKSWYVQALSHGEKHPKTYWLTLNYFFKIFIENFFTRLILIKLFFPFSSLFPFKMYLKFEGKFFVEKIHEKVSILPALYTRISIRERERERVRERERGGRLEIWEGMYGVHRK